MRLSRDTSVIWLKDSRVEVHLKHPCAALRRDVDEPRETRDLRVTDARPRSVDRARRGERSSLQGRTVLLARAREASRRPSRVRAATSAFLASARLPTGTVNSFRSSASAAASQSSSRGPAPMALASDTTSDAFRGLFKTWAAQAVQNVSHFPKALSVSLSSLAVAHTQRFHKLVRLGPR